MSQNFDKSWFALFMKSRKKILLKNEKKLPVFCHKIKKIILKTKI